MIFPDSKDRFGLEIFAEQAHTKEKGHIGKGRRQHRHQLRGQHIRRIGWKEPDQKVHIQHLGPID